jgi:hypothetical protein
MTFSNVPLYSRHYLYIVELKATARDSGIFLMALISLGN